MLKTRVIRNMEIRGEKLKHEIIMRKSFLKMGHIFFLLASSQRGRKLERLRTGATEKRI